MARSRQEHRAGLYARISLDPTGQALGVERQLGALRKLAAERGWEIAEEYVDNNRSAYRDTAKRPAFERLLEAVSAGRVDVVAAWHTDRLARHPRTLERLVAVCERRGVPVVTVQAGSLDLATPSGRAVARTLAAWAAHEVEIKGTRQAARHQANAETGRWSGGRVPYGYTRVGAAELDEDPDTAPVVREIVARILTGESLRRIAADLERREVPAPSGPTWYPSTVRSIAASPRYAGLREHRGRIVGPAKWPALVRPEDHAQAARIIADSTRRTTTTNARSRLLSGIARCQCGAVIISGATSGGGHPTYRCATRAHVVRACGPVDDFVSAVIVERLRRPDVLALLAADRGRDAEAVAEQIATVEQRLEELAQAWAEDDAMTTREYRAATSRLRERHQALRDQARGLATLPAAVALVDAETPARGWERLGLAERRSLVDALVDVVLLPPGRGVRTFDPDTVRITWKGRTS